MIKKIVAIGPESTGKSTLCKLLAAHFRTSWCPEYAREYLNKNGIKYNYDNLIKIAQGQLVTEDSFEENLKLTSSNLNAQSSMLKAQSKLLFVDTDMYVMKVWYEYVFGRCEYFVLNEIAKRNYDLYLLCNTDLPWAADKMREYPDEQPRKELFNIYKDILINQKTKWIEISGDYNERLITAIHAVNNFLL